MLIAILPLLHPLFFKLPTAWSCVIVSWTRHQINDMLPVHVDEAGLPSLALLLPKPLVVNRRTSRSVPKMAADCNGNYHLGSIKSAALELASDRRKQWSEERLALVDLEWYTGSIWSMASNLSQILTAMTNKSSHIAIMLDISMNLIHCDHHPTLCIMSHLHYY